MKNLTLIITGMSPLLMHSTNGMNVVKEGIRTKADYVTGQEEAEIGCYRDSGGGLVFPSIAISRSLWDAASMIKIGKITARKALAGLIQTVEFVQVLDPSSGKQLTEFEVDTRFVNVNKSRVPRSRAKIPEWSMHIPVDYDPNLLSSAAIGDLLSRAGSLIGIGDFRPSTGGGPFGRFTVEIDEPDI